MNISKINDITSASQQMQNWIDNFGPNYFDFNLINNYRTGIFGYINEVMSNISEDAFNAVTIARREFYPNTALYTSSLYTMLALQELDAPLHIPAVVRAVLVVKESDILPTIINGNDFIIDDTTTFMADEIPFMLDFPIRISGSKNSNRLSGGIREQYAYTIRYDTEYENTLSNITQIYLQNKIITSEGDRLLLIVVDMHQVKMDISEFTISKNTHIDIVTEDIVFNGNLASFEVFYRENDTASEIQLKKVLIDTATPTVPFVTYKLVDNNTLRLLFPANSYFTPTFNSNISVRLYTTLGTDGNFDEYNGRLSTQNIYTSTFNTSNVIIDGQTMGASVGGRNRDEELALRNEIIYAYSTNNTITTDNDLQKYFDKNVLDYNNKVIFFKQRDDVFTRLFGAFMLLKDKEENVIPSNTLNMTLNQGLIKQTTPNGLSPDSDFDEYYDSTNRLIMKAGALFRYKDDEITSDFSIVRDKTITLMEKRNYEYISNTINKFFLEHYKYDKTVVSLEIDSNRFEVYNTDLDSVISDMVDYVYEITKTDISTTYEKYIRIRYEMNDEGVSYVYVAISYFIFTNPFIISVLRDPNMVTFFMPSINESLPLQYTDIAKSEDSYIQFLVNSMRVSRDAVIGENFYKFTMSVTPSIIEEEFSKLMYTDNSTTIITAKDSGYIEFIKYLDEDPVEQIDRAGVYAKVLYNDNTHEYIRVSSNVYNTGVDYLYLTGHEMIFDVGESFNKGDELATMKVTDLSTMRVMLILNKDEFTANEGRYIPMILESVNIETNYYTFAAYVATNDEIGSNNTITLTRGVFDINGTEKTNKEVTIYKDDMDIDVYMFIKYQDVNTPGNWSQYNYIQGNYTYTNQYSLSSDVLDFGLMKNFAYIRSVSDVEYDSLDPNNPQAVGGITTYYLKSIPLIESSWISERDNNNYVTSAILNNYTFIDNVYNYLENNFSIDLKFYNSYGRSRFYKVGVKNNDENMRNLDRINSSFSFGIKLNTLSSVEAFTAEFIEFVKDYVESLNDVISVGKPIYIMNLVSAIKTNFEEILYLEYYGMNQYDYSVQKVISTYEEKIKTLGYNEYVPEFINIDNITLTFLD